MQVPIPPQRNNTLLRRFDSFESIFRINNPALVETKRRKNIQNEAIATLAVPDMPRERPHAPDRPERARQVEELVLPEMRRQPVDVHVRRLLPRAAQPRLGHRRRETRRGAQTRSIALETQIDSERRLRVRARQPQLLLLLLLLLAPAQPATAAREPREIDGARVVRGTLLRVQLLVLLERLQLARVRVLEVRAVVELRQRNRPVHGRGRQLGRRGLGDRAPAVAWEMEGVVEGRGRRGAGCRGREGEGGKRLGAVQVRGANAKRKCVAWMSGVPAELCCWWEDRRFVGRLHA
jgi:hypothetical protein